MDGSTDFGTRVDDCDLTDAAFAALMREAGNNRNRDIEAAHWDADRILRKLALRLGYTETVKAWDAVGKWYA